MQKIRLIVIIAVLMMSLLGVMAQDQTIAEAAAGNENLSTLAGLLESAGLTETLNGEGPFTVFAPNNDAFAALPADVAAFVTDNPDVLSMVLNYHVVAGEVADGENATVEGDAVVVDGATVDGVNIVDEMTASNGTIKVVDAVLIPDVELPAVDPLDYSDGSIVTAGSSTVFPLLERMAELWSDGGGVAPSIDSIGTGAGFERFCVAGETDIANASRAVNEEELASCAAINRTPLEFRIGTDALAVTVSAENDFLTDVTLEELGLIFSTATNWSDVRPEWPAEPICRFIPGTDSGTFDYFVEKLYEKDEAPILAASCLQLSEDDNVLVQGIEGSPYAIGFFGYAYYLENAANLHILNIEGVEPNGVTAEDGSYPLSRPLFLYSDAQILADKPEVAAFINYVLTNVDAEIVDVGYFPASDRALNLSRAAFLADTAE